MSGRARRRGRPAARRAATAAVLVVAVAWVLLPGVAPAQSGDAPPPVTITGVEPPEASAVVAAMARVMATGSQQLTIDDIAEGSGDGRRNFVEGGLDFVVSGVPFSGAELAAIRSAGRDVIGAPFQAVGIGLFGFAPSLPVFPPRCVVTEQFDPECTLADASRYDGPVRLAPSVLADLFYERSNIWALPELQQALAVPADGTYLFPPISGPRPLVRNDADATNLYLDRYLATVAGDSRRQVLAGIPGANPDAVSETWPNPVTPSRQGEDNVVSQVCEGLDPGASAKSEGGSVGVASLLAIAECAARNEEKPPGEQVGLFLVQLRNGAGEWVSPSPAAITASLAASNGQPLGGAVDPVPGAWPLTWVNRLYAPSTGLTPDQANAVATMVRVQVTGGQADGAADALGDGKLPKALVDEALAAADRIVRSNCEAAKGQVYSSPDLGPFTSPGAGRDVLGSVSLCRGTAESPAPSTTTTTEAPVEVAAAEALPEVDTSYDASVYDDSGYSADAPTVDGIDAAFPAAADGLGVPSAAGGTATPTRPIAAQGTMPLGLPGGTLSPLDRATTALLGAGAFLTGRRMWMRRVAAV